MSSLRSINVNLPGSYGLNTIEDTVPADAEAASRFGSQVWNGVVGVNGKLTSREDFALQTGTGSGQVFALHMHRRTTGTEEMLVAKADTLLRTSGGTTLTTVATMTGLHDPQFASFNDYVMVAEAGVSAVIYSNVTWGAVAPSGNTWVKPAVCVAGYGRMWVANDASISNIYTIWWSNLLDPLAWASGDAGNINITNAWPTGADYIVAIALAFNRVIIFGRSTILMYTLGADNDPANMTLTDTIENIGCVAQHSVVTTDEGIFFLSDNGLFRIDKLGQVTSLMTLLEMSKLYGADIRGYIAAETASQIRGGYYPKEGWYTLTFPSSNVTACVHTRKQLPAPFEVPLTTLWNNTGMPFYGFCFDSSGNWYCGGESGVYKYGGYTPDAANNAYNFTYYTQWLNYGDESRLKHLKGVVLILNAASGQTGTLYWLEDYIAGTSRSVAFTCDAVEFAEDPGVGAVRIAPLGGSCNAIKYGVVFPINGDAVTIQQLRLFANPGAMKF